MDSRRPTQRWQLKAMEQGVQRLNLSSKQSADSGANCSASLLGTSLLNLSLSTPALSVGSDGSFRHSPARSPARLSRTPANSGRSPSRRSSSTPSLMAPPAGLDGSLSLRAGANRTPSRSAASGGRTPGAGDRFIPCRSATDLENSYNSLIRGGGGAGGASNGHDSSAVNGAPDETGGSGSGGGLMTRPTGDFQRQLMTDTLNDGGRESRILCFQARPPRPAAGHANNLRVLYSSSKTAAARAPSTRHIPSQPDRVLDAPDLLDDYYLHPLDWSGGNQLAVALRSAIYVWNAAGGGTTCLAQLDDDVYVCSVSWVPDSGGSGAGGAVLAVGDSAGNVQLWDAERQQRLRLMRGHRDRVTTVAWNEHIVSSGCRSGDVHHYDVRVAAFHVGQYSGGHVQEVCGLRWSLDGRLLATGGNDNQLLIWDSLAGLGGGSAEPLHVLSDHQAAVKSLAWCPWSSHVLASGGGTADRCIRFWNGSSGQLFNTVATNSQVSALLWSPDYKEIMSGHGFSYNQLTLWKYPQMDKVVDLTGHDSRVLELAVSPDGSTVASAAADETIRLWKCWETDPASKKSKTGKNSVTSAFRMQGIR